jgi:DNA-binding XRE family transcriptional regulator
MSPKHPLTQDDFAKLIGTSRWTVNSIETGRRKPSRDLIVRISMATDTAVGFSELTEAA